MTVSSEPVTRSGFDNCPGALSVHRAADGNVARVRLPGGALSVTQLYVLAIAAAELGSGQLELTSRANLQIRGMADGAEQELSGRLIDAGLLPSDSHEKARNIVASPLSGLDNAGTTNVSPLVAELDAALCARPVLAGLSGRFLFALDDGRGDVAAMGADVTFVATGHRRGTLYPGGKDIYQPVQAMLDLAEAFLAERDARGSQAWRISDLDGGADAVAHRVFAQASSVREFPAAPRHPIGRHGVAQVLAVRLGRLDLEQVQVIADSGPKEVRITPWRSIVVVEPADRADLLARAAITGMAVDDTALWYGHTACVGRPGCAKALADVQGDARFDAYRWTGRAVHWSGCSRMCGRPVGTEVDIVATASGYEITDHAADAETHEDPDAGE